MLFRSTGVAEAIAQQFGTAAANRKAVQETIENNTRRTISEKHGMDPAFYDQMSAILDEIIRFRKQHAEAYAEYLRGIADLARQVRPDGWRGLQAKEQRIKAARFGVSRDAAAVERIFAVLVAQPES